MVSIRSSRLAAATVLLSASSTMASINTVKPVLNSDLSLPGLTASQFGCYGSSQGMTWAGNFNFMTSSICQIYCLNLNMPAMGTSAGTDCYCGATAPPLAAKLDDSKCSANCTGYGQEMCGGSNSTGGGVILSIWNDQLSSSITNSGDALADTSSTSSATSKPTTSPTSTTPAVVTVTNPGGSVVTIVASSSATNQASGGGGGGASKAGIAAGVVVGFIVIAGVAGGVWFFMRQKRRREVEEEHKRQVAVSSFVAGGKPGSAGGSTLPDTRLDPAILRERRMSDGSIMDNQDYSRRILKVTNA